MADMNCFRIKPQPHLASELHAVNDVPHLVGEPLGVLTGGGIVVEPLLNHPVPELLQMTVTSPGVLVELQTFDVCSC